MIVHINSKKAEETFFDRRKQNKTKIKHASEKRGNFMRNNGHILPYAIF